MNSNSPVSKVTVLDPAGEKCWGGLPSNLAGYKIIFDVHGKANQDFYRVEVHPDHELEVGDVVQIEAGFHTKDPQSFEVPLQGSAIAGYEITIHQLDEAAAKKDSNQSGKIVSKETFAVIRNLS